MQVAELLARLLALAPWAVHGAGGRAGHHGTMFWAAHPWPDPETTVPAGDGGGL